MKGLRLIFHQAHYDLKVFWRNPQSRFFTVAIPVMFLFIFVAVFGNNTTRVNGHRIHNSTYYVPYIAALGLISAAFGELTISIVTQRERGVLMRFRSAPAPTWVIIVSRVLLACMLAALLVLALILIGWLVFGVQLPGSTVPGVIVTTIVGAVSFCCLGLGLSTFIRSAESAPPVTNMLILPLLFISGIFFPNELLPHWLYHVASYFPVQHLGHSLVTAFAPETKGVGIVVKDLLWMVGWGILGLLIALRRFNWMPRRGS
jgi:ABC-2 type transport system permease protein